MEHYFLGLLGLALPPSIVSFASTIFYFIITIFILVSIHEFGHFFAGRMFGMYVPIYSIGMGRRVFGWNRLNGFTFGPLDPQVELQLGAHTDYRLSMLPFGGYAKIEGMIDETQTDALPSEIKPYEFRAKPWWQKSIVICAGVFLNAVLAWFIFSAKDYVQGKDYHLTTTVGYVSKGSVSEKLGLRTGDRILSINNHAVTSWEDLRENALIKTAGINFPLVYERDGVQHTVQYKASELTAGENRDIAFGLMPDGYGPPTIDSLYADNPVAARAGLKKGDVVTKIDDDSIYNAVAFIDKVRASNGRSLNITVLRGGVPQTFAVTPIKTFAGDSAYRIGVMPGEQQHLGKLRHEDYSLLQAASVGWDDLIGNFSSTIVGLWRVITGKIAAKAALGGPIKIAQMANQSASGGFIAFINFVALLSMSLALLNILPIPALDGGHLVIILLEAVLGRELSQRGKLNFQKVGVALLLTLMAFMIFNDMSGLLFK